MFCSVDVVWDHRWSMGCDYPSLRTVKNFYLEIMEKYFLRIMTEKEMMKLHSYFEDSPSSLTMNSKDSKEPW